VKTEELVTLAEDVPIELWRDAVTREAFWAAMRRKLVTGVAVQRPGWSLADGREDRHARYMRRADGVGGEPENIETTPEHAEFVRLRLSCWAAEQ
jgi:hypothetical protein